MTNGTHVDGKKRRIAMPAKPRDLRRDRLSEAVQMTECDLEVHTGGNGRNKPRWLSQAKENLRLAQEAITAGDVERAWALVHRASELEVFGYDSARVTSEALTLSSELCGAKYAPWRRIDIQRHLDHVLARSADKSGWLLPLDERRVWLAGAMRTRHDGYAKVYQDLALVRRYQGILLTTAVLILLAALAGSVFANPSFESGVDKWWVVLGAALSGALGGITSALQRTTRRAITRVPQRMGSSVQSLSRPIVGAIAGMTVLLAVRAGITQTTDGSKQQVAYVLLLAFGAGFSERLLVRDPREDVQEHGPIAVHDPPPVTPAPDTGITTDAKPAKDRSRHAPVTRAGAKSASGSVNGFSSAH